MTVNGNTLYFVNDTVTYNGVTYYYVKNLQGDIVAILDASGNAVVEYTYNAWGVLLSTTGSMASTLGLHNPLRYRGYVYDTETALYYLQSRYYDPDVGRFINADDVDVLLEYFDDVLSANLFAYCLNNPVNMYDPDGYFALEATLGGGFLSGLWVTGASNAWNVVGWVSLGVAGVATVVYVGYQVYESAKTEKSESDPYARPGQKKQGRERKNKSRTKSTWQARSNPKPPKKHTPGRDHRKYKK